MKKRILSAFLALAMLFSIMPTSFASSTYDETNGFDDKSPISYLKVDYTADGGIDSIKVKPYKSHTGKSNIRVTIAYRDTYIDMQDGNGATAIDAAATLGDGSTADGLAANLDGAFDTTPYMTPIYSAVGEVTTTQTELQAINTTIDQTATSTYQPFSWNAAGWWIAYMMYGNDEDMAEAQKGDLEAMLCDAAGDSIGLYPTEIPIRIYAVSATGTILNTFYWDDVIKVGQAGTIEVPSGGDTPSEDTAIPSVALDVTAPKIGATPATTATTSTTGVVANPAVTWDPADSTFAKNQAYKASVTLSADSGYKFTDSTTATINGKTATVTLNGDGTLKAEYTFDAIKLTGISSNKTGLTSSFAPNDSYTVPDGLEVTLRYSDGTEEVVPYGQFQQNNLSLVIGADSATATDLPANLTLGNNNQTVYVKYSGTDTNDGNPKYQAIDTITVANAKITTAQVSVTYPKPGGTPDTVATVPDGANYTAEVTWKYKGTEVTGNFEYDKAYDAIITVKPNTGYALDNTNGVVLTVKDKTAANPGADKTDTIASDDIDGDGSGVKTVSFDATASTPISASISDSFDLYDKNDVNITLTLGTHVIGDITGITIDGQTLSSSDYTISGNIITVKGASLATKLTDLTSTAANKNVEITVTGQTTATTTSLSAVDTTPYITITDPSQGAITSSPTIATGTRVALKKDTAYTLTAPTVAHTTGYTWTVNGITGIDNGKTYTFTPSGSENITATVALTVDAGHKLTINKTGNGTVTVAKDGGSTLTAESDGTYTVYYDESYTVTATAADQNKVTAVTGETISGVQKTVTHAVANPTADTTVEVTFATKTAPTVSADMTYRKGTNDTDKVFTITLGDYSDVEIGATTPSGTWAVDKATYTVSKSDLETASNGDHTYTFDFGEGMTITKKISVLAARSIENVTAPTGPFAHGDTFNLIGLSFTVKENGTDTTYTYDGTSWSPAIPTETKFSLDGTNFSDWDTFKAAAEAKITRHDTTDSNAVNNGAQITVSLGTPTKASNDISVGTKAITVNPSQTTDINKVYDGTVTAPSISATIPTGELVGDDKVTASVTAVYQDGVSTGLTDKNASDNVKNVVFTGTLSGANAGNYTIKAIPNGSGKISKRTVKIAIINNVPAATKNKADTQTGNATATIPTNTEYDLNTPYEVVDGETVAITYDYLYATISSVGPVSDVTVRNIATTNTNYTVEPTYLENQNGTVNNRTIKSIAISDPTKKEYNYSDTFDPTGIKVTVTYDGETDPVVYAWNDVPDDITLKWTGTDEALSTTHKFDSVGTGKYTITASATGVEPATTNDITVAKLFVNVVVSGNITKVYNGDGDLDDDDADGITYTVTNASDGYEDQFNADNVTVSSQSVTYKDSLVGNVGVWISNCESDNPNYKVSSVKNQVNATITKRPITVTAITVPTVKQYSNDTDVLVEKVGTPDVTFNNVVSGEKVTVDYKYTYNDTSVAGDTDDITINNLVLNSANSVNANYELTESTYTKSGHVDEREVGSLTVTAPTQFATAQTYGTALALAGLKVQVNFTSGGTSDGSETYVWKDATTWTKQVEGQSDVDVITVPFTLAWSGTTDVPTQDETLTVQRNSKGIKASYTGTDVNGTSGAIKVNPIVLTDILIAGENQSKTYDSTKTLTNPGFTYQITNDVLSGDDTEVKVEPTTVEYAEADVHTSQPLNITGFHLTKSKDGNYALGTPHVVGTPNGTISKRNITLTAITNIPDINRFEAGIGTGATATSASGATFEALTVNTGIITGQTVTVTYDYAYADNTTVSDSATVNLSNVALDTASAKNYELIDNATATGKVKEVAATGIKLAIPDKTYEYGDKLDLTGTTVTVNYGLTNTEIYTSDDGVTWKKNGVDASTKPFTVTLPTDKDSLAVGTATVSVKVKDGVEDSVSRTVNKRKVTVTPSKNGDVTKVYDGNTTYTNGVITWTVSSVNTISGLDMPTVTGATYTYDYATVSDATKITVSAPVLSDTTNFEIDGYTDTDFAANITARPLVITGISIPDVNKYADVSQTVTGAKATNTTGATFEATDTNTGIVSGETVGVTYDYKYATSVPASGTTTDVDITNIALDTSVGTSANYSLSPNSLTGSANVVERAINNITVANPTQFDSDVRYNDKLNIAGLKVTINYTDSTSEVYTATEFGGVVSWALNGANISEGNIPFTLTWRDSTNSGTFAQGQTLSVTGHNGNKIVANHKNGNDSGEGSAVTIKPIEITSINATKNGDITKTYNGDTELNDASKSNIGYTSTQVIGGDTVTLGATPAYENKNVGQNKAISFTTPTVSGNDNYTLGTDATVTGDVVGDITVKTVAISNVYIPSIYKDTEDLVKSISNASAIASGHPTANTVVAADILSGDRANLTFAYKLTYANSTDDNPTVTISDTSVTGTESGNYEFTWPTGLTGTVIADAFTDATITAPTNMSYTHGDKFNPTGLSVTIKTSSNPTGTTYTVTGTDGNYKWDTAIPNGVTVSLGTISLNSNDALNFNAHYTKMNGKKITVNAGDKNAETGEVAVAKKQLTATASIDTADKTYDSTTGLTSDQHVTYTIGDNGVQSFNGTADKVSVTANASYKDANVSKTGATINNVGITFTNIGLDGDDKDNYIAPTSIADIEGKINPYTINITEIGEVAPTAYYKINKSGTIDSTVDYTAEMNGLTKPAITFDYDYGTLVDKVESPVNVPISNIAFVTATDNFVIRDKPSTIKGSVEVQGIQKIEITKVKNGYKYGDTLDLSDLSVKVTYVGGETKDGIRYNDTDWNTLSLTLNTTLPTDGTTILKNSTDNGKTITVEKDTVNSNAITINVAKRTVLIERDGSDAIQKTYDGTPAVGQTITLKVADSQEGYDGVYNNDITGVTAPTYIYSSKDAQNNIALTGTPTLVGSNLDEYNPTYPTLTGNISKKSVTLTPVITEDIYENKFATEDKTITETSATVNNGKVTQNGIVSGEESNFTFGYTVTVPKADLATASPKSYAPTSTSESGTGKDNYTFTWNNANVNIKTNAAASMAVTTDPSDIANQKHYGDSISLNGMVVTITYGNGSTHDFTYGSTEWDNEGFTVAIEDGGDFSKLVTGNNDKHIVVSKTGLNSANTIATLKVNKKDLHLTAEKADGLSAIEKTYDTTTDAKSILKFGITSTDLVSDDGVTVISSNVSATFDTKNQGSDKDITISGLTITGDNSDQYNVIMPSGVKGKINPKSITVKVAGVADILAGVSGEDLKKTASINYSEQPESGVSVTVTATYPDSTQDPVGQKTEKTLTFTKTETGNELGNYVFTLDENGVKGYVVSNIINQINVTNPTKTTYIHGDNLSLAGMVIEVKYQDSRDDNTYTCQEDGTWKDKNNSAVTELPVSFALKKDGTENALSSQTQQLRRDKNDGAKLVVKGGDVNNDDTTLIVNKREITEVTVPTTPSLEKTYDGTTTVTQPISYEGVGVLADDDAVNSLISAKANYDTKDVAFESDGTTVAKKTINFSNIAMSENTNYTMSSAATVTTSIKGKINPKDLTVTITSVPSIIVGQSTTVTLEKGADKNYTQSGEVEVNGVKEEVNLTVTGEYAQNSIAQENVNVTYSVTNKDSYKNYNITWNSNVKGTVNKKPITKIEVTNPTTSTWSHGDILTLDGMKIKVTYSDGDTKTYTHSGGAWDNTPEDVTITWGDTTNPATDGVIRLDDTNKDLQADSDNKKTSVKVTATVPNTTGEYENKSTDITVTKKQLTLEVSGNIEKVYDNNNSLTTDNRDNVSLTLNGVAGSDGVTLSDSTKDNIQYGGTTVKDTASSPKLVIGTVVLNDNANNQYYILPSDASITNNTTGKINKRPVKVTSVTKNMNTTVDSPKTGTLEKVVQSSTDGYGISGDAGFYSILDGHTIMVDIPYEYEDTSSEGIKTVTYDNVTAKVSAKGTDGNADYVANYEVSFAIADGSATISNGTVTGIKIDTTTQEYTHGDLFNLPGTKITVTYNNGAKQDTYEYDIESGKWIKNGADTTAELPSEIGIKLGDTTINANPTSDTDKTVVRYDKLNPTKELKATYTKSGSASVPSTGNPSITLKKKPVTITVDNNGTDAINHTYSGNNSLTADEIGKLKFTPDNFKVVGDDVTLSGDTISATIGNNANGNVADNLTINATGYVLSGTDADNYEISYVNNAKGNIVKAPLTITINSVPSINEGATELNKTLTRDVNYTVSGEVNGERVEANVNARYDDSNYTGGTADKNVTYSVTNEDAYPNYDITVTGSPKGSVTQKTAEVEIDHQPNFVTASPRPQHGDKLGANGLDGLEYTVRYSDGSTTKHKHENGDWLTTGGYTAPEDGTAFTWENTSTAVSSDSEIRKDMYNKIKITVPTATNEPLTDSATADKKKVKITANGTYTKVYDGTNTVTLNETTPEITYTVSGVATGDTVTVTATPAFVDGNVAKFGDVYQKAINFTNVSISNTDNYEIEADENENDITPIMGAITPKTINITALTVPSSTKGSAGEKTVTKNKNFTTTDILEKDKDNVTIGYKATFVTSATGTVDATVTDAKVDGSNDQMTLNYVVGTVTGAKIEITSSNHGGGGGGGGGGGNSLSIKYENADGTAGKDVSKIEAPAGSDPVDLIAVFVTKPANPTVIWTSDNESVATVDENGIVKFIGEGTAIITAQSKTNKTLKDTVTVTVTKAVATPTPKPANPTPEPTKEPSIITKTMLNPYIVGYDDNVFGPELPISREEVSAIFARLIANNIYMDKAYDTSFPDVGEGWSKDYIGYLEKFSVVTGYEDGTFRPQNYITRAEMAVMMAKAEGYDISGYMSSDELAYPDVDEGYSEWAVKAIKYLTDRGIMEGYPDGTFGPNRPITRAETVATVNRVLADMTVGNIEVLPSDMTEAHWAYNDVVFAMNHRILKDVAADESQFIKSEEYDKNKITETEVVEDTSDEKSGAGASPTPEPSPTPNA